MKKGFTLVELSIVLVIIGLLIGGILAAQSIIKTAKVQSFIRQIQQYDIAVGNFHTTYNQIPGDSNLITPPGNNDGTIGDFVSDTSCNAGTCSEYMSFWKHLSDSGMLKETYNNDYTIDAYGSAIKPGINVPAVTYGYLKAAYNNVTFGAGGAQGNVYVDGSRQPKTLSSYADTLSIELKMDDGDFSTGNVRALDPATGLPCSVTAASCQLSIIIGLNNAQ